MDSKGDALELGEKKLNKGIPILVALFVFASIPSSNSQEVNSIWIDLSKNKVEQTNRMTLDNLVVNNATISNATINDMLKLTKKSAPSACNAQNEGLVEYISVLGQTSSLKVCTKTVLDTYVTLAVSLV